MDSEWRQLEGHPAGLCRPSLKCALFHLGQHREHLGNQSVWLNTITDHLLKMWAFNMTKSYLQKCLPEIIKWICIALSVTQKAGMDNIGVIQTESNIPIHPKSIEIQNTHTHIRHTHMSYTHSRTRTHTHTATAWWAEHWREHSLIKIMSEKMHFYISLEGRERCCGGRRKGDHSSRL